MCAIFTTVLAGKPVKLAVKLTVDVATLPDASLVCVRSMVTLPLPDASAPVMAGDSFAGLRSAVKRVVVGPVVVEGDELLDEQADARRMPRATIESRFMCCVTPLMIRRTSV